MGKVASDSVVVSFRIEPKYLEKLKTFARRKSAKEDADVTYADIIREMIKQKTKGVK